MCMNTLHLCTERILYAATTVAIQSVVILSLVIKLFSLNQIDAILPRKLAKRSKSIMKVQRHLTLVTVISEGHNK